ncbi:MULTISPECIES: DNA internalization-related competence protein ComEC/Rec2 [unclassified Cupriavidus]|uniref:DNA internalization-related competence protein ComEC/Rec2 n=1 Tax=Cupriavidus sp. H19C3 TaxID=3241603 RepID=UPI003BF8CD52
MRLCLLAFVAGCWWLQQQGRLPAWPGFLPVVVLAMAWLAWRRAHARAVAIVLALTLGAGWAAWRADQRLADWLPEAEAGQDRELAGVIAGLPDEADHGTRFVFRADRHVPARVLLTWRKPPVKLVPGQRWQLTVRLRPPRGLANPHGFDYAYWLLGEGIGATGYVRAARAGPQHDDAARIERWRAQLRDRLRAALPPDARLGGVLVALAIGDQRGIAAADWEVFRRTGIAHLVSISGLHITMLSGAAGALVHWLWRHSFGFGRILHRPPPGWRRGLRWCALPLWCPARHAALVAAVLTALGYGLLAGMQIPALRTVTMLTVAAIALWGGRAPPPSLVLAWSAAAAVALDPWAVMAPGFWLSFGAVAVILLVAVRARQSADMTWPARLRAWLADAARVQWAVTVGLVPLTLLLFGQVSVVSAVANALAIPVVSLVVTPLALAAAVLPHALASFALAVAHTAMVWLSAALAWLAAPSWAVWEAAHAGWIPLVLAVLGVAHVLMPGGNRAMRSRGVLLMLPMLVAGRHPVPHGEMRITALDVGQGTAVLVETRRHALLYDTGPAYASGASAGAQVVVPYLRAMGVRRLDQLMVSHEDADHAGGVREVEAVVPVRARLTAAPPGQPWMAQPWRPCAAGASWEWDGVGFAILHPPAAQVGNARHASNARSCVLRVVTAQRSVLLTGDIGVREERAIVARMAQPAAAATNAAYAAYAAYAANAREAGKGGDGGEGGEVSDVREVPAVAEVAEAGDAADAGDIGAAEDPASPDAADMALAASASLQSDILIVPHHGSGTSSGDAFLRAVAPELAIFQLGYRNRYRHPRADVWARYERLGIARYRTDETGAVSIVTRGACHEVSTYRQRVRRYWREAPPVPR